MTIDLTTLASRPAASITDEEVAVALEVIRADARVTKAVAAGRENGASDGRQLVDFEMIGFAGVHTLGRVISAFQQADRLAAAAAAQERLAAQKAAQKTARERERLLKLVVPAEGADEDFDDWADSVESDLSGVYGELVHDRVERARLYEAYLDSLKPAKARAPKWTGPSLAGLVGSTKQKHWAAKIRDEYTRMMTTGDRDRLYNEFPKSSWWIENRSNISKAIEKARR